MLSQRDDALSQIKEASSQYGEVLEGTQRLASERDAAHTAFAEDACRVMVATVAFGMGLDKSDVHAVVNVGMPRSIEAYVQQVRP